MGPWGTMVAVATYCCGCDLVFKVQVPADAPAGDDICDVLLEDTFDDSTACAPEGTEFSLNTTVVTTGGELVIMPLATDSNGGCHYDLIGREASFFAVEVSRTLTAQDGFTALQLPMLDRVIAANNGLFVYSTYDPFVVLDEVTFAPDLMRWWRLVPDRANGTLAAEYSQDGRSWSPVGPPAPTTFGTLNEDVVVIAGFQAVAEVESAAFDRLVICR